MTAAAANAALDGNNHKLAFADRDKTAYATAPRCVPVLRGMEPPLATETTSATDGESRVAASFRGMASAKDAETAKPPTRSPPRREQNQRLAAGGAPSAGCLRAYWPKAFAINATRNTKPIRIVGIPTIQKALFFQNAFLPASAIISVALRFRLPVDCSQKLADGIVGDLH